VELRDSLEDGAAGENLPELQIRVSKASGDKCSRCWNYAASVGANTEHPEICHRCLEALA
jgi:isoleucyl-tRNA synthetase